LELSPKKAMAEILQPGDLVESLDGNELEGFYKPGDVGVVQSFQAVSDELRIHVVWHGTGRVCATRTPEWQSCLRLLRREVLEVGDVVEVLPDRTLTVDKQEVYRFGDQGTVLNFAGEAGGAEPSHVRIVWTRSQGVSDILVGTWMTVFRLLKKARALESGCRAQIHSMKGAVHLNGQLVSCKQFDPEKGRWTVQLQGGEEKSVKAENLKVVEDSGADLAPGDLVQALPNVESASCYGPGDLGTVQQLDMSEGEPRVHVVWASTGKMLSMRRVGWHSLLKRLRPQELGLADAVQALPERSLSTGGAEVYGPGDEGIVAGFPTEGEPHVRILWTRSHRASDVPVATWMSTCRLIRKACPGEQPPSLGPVPEVGSGAVPVAPRPPPEGPFTPGALARLHGLMAAPRLNGQLVRCVRWEAAKGRWLVTVETDEAVVAPIEKSIKPANMTPA